MMNIFHLDLNPSKAAQCLCDKHIVKMALESAQILCAVSWRYGVEAPYKASHKNHPAVLWAGNTFSNWLWLVSHGQEICREYTRRYGKTHKSEAIINWSFREGGRPTGGKFTMPPLCMPDQYKCDNYVEAYRNYYLNDKVRFASWKIPAAKPEWWIQ